MMVTRTRGYAVAARRMLGILMVLGLIGLTGIGSATGAYAASGDSIEDYTIGYEVKPDGSVEVNETFTYNFGSSNPHGFDRTYVTREKYDDKQDAVYTYSDIQISSTTGAATSYRTSTSSSGSDGKLKIRIGDPRRTVDRTETYTIRYRVSGALRSFQGYDEFVWDSGFEMNVPIKNLRARVKVPGGVQETSCTTGPPGSTTPCAAKDVQGGEGVYAQPSLSRGSGMTLGAKITPGLVSNPRPTLVPRGSNQGTGSPLASPTALYGFGGATGLAAVLAPLIGWRYWRRRGVDQRYVGLAPGTTPVRGQQVPVGPSGKVNIPVAFSPPPIPVGEAGMLIDGSMDVEDTTATLVDLAVRGAIRLSDDPAQPGGKAYVATLVDPSVSSAPHEVVLLNQLFGGRPPGATVPLGARGTMTDAHDAVSRSVQNQVTQRGWFRRIRGGTGIKIGAAGFWVVVAIGMFSGMGLGMLLLAAPLVPIIITVLVVRSKMKRGQRTAEGRAVCDQVEGFKTYLATAEADQLRFEEGEDIFSRYLPWAIMFGLAERWAQLCGELVAAGRIPDMAPGWYHGDFHTFNVLYLTDALSTSAMPEISAPDLGSIGSGFGGGSSFDGGGFSGLGGGGGGIDSW